MYTEREAVTYHLSNARRHVSIGINTTSSLPSSLLPGVLLFRFLQLVVLLLLARGRGGSGDQRVDGSAVGAGIVVGLLPEEHSRAERPETDKQTDRQTDTIELYWHPGCNSNQ